MVAKAANRFGLASVFPKLDDGAARSVAVNDLDAIALRFWCRASAFELMMPVDAC